MMEAILIEAQRLRLWRPLDVQFALMLAKSTEPALMLASAWLSADAGAGHICLPLTLLTQDRLFDGRMPLLAKKAWLKAGDPSQRDWQELLLESSAVSNGSSTPLIIDNQRLYLHRMWRYECTIARFFSLARPPLEVDDFRIAAILKRYFSSDDNTVPDWQKIAAAVAITHPVSLIFGESGTGKTSMISMLLAVLLQLRDAQGLRIRIAAPTVRTAAQLSDSLGLAIHSLELNEEQKKQFPLKAITIHHLLGAQANGQRLRYHQGNPLHVDILIIDEVSMVDLQMMINIIAALPPQARVIFLGDHCQLSSVKSGAILRDIYQFTKTGYSPARRAQLMRLTDFNLPIGESDDGNEGYGVADSLCLLRKSYRFSDGSNISQLAKYINTGDIKNALELLKIGTASDVNYIPLNEMVNYQNLLDSCVKGYRTYLQMVLCQDRPDAILIAFNRFRLLCALREGPFGSDYLNDYIEKSLSQTGLLTASNVGCSYAGRPVMILRNALSLGLYNGDVGIFLQDEKQTLRAYFSMPDGDIKTVSLNLLPEHKTVFAMTVHESQGSEFPHTTLVLPNQILPILTRELLYTAVMKAQSKFSIYATDEVVQYAIANRTQRRSGLIERLIRLATPAQ